MTRRLSRGGGGERTCWRVKANPGKATVEKQKGTKESSDVDGIGPLQARVRVSV